MKIVIDTDTGRLMLADTNGMRELSLYSPEGLAALSRLVEQVTQRQSEPGARLESFLRAIPALQPRAIVVVGAVSSNLLSHFANSSHHTLIVVAPEFSDDQRAACGNSRKVTLFAGDPTDSETADRIRKALPADGGVNVVLQIDSSRGSALHELEMCAEFVSVGASLFVVDDEPTDAASGQLEQPAAVHEFAMEHGEFRLTKSPGISAGAYCLQRVK